VLQLGTPPGRNPSGPDRAYVVGPMREHADILYEGPSSVLGVRFQPGGGAAFLKPPADGLVDGVLGLEEVWRDVPALVDEIAAAPPGERVARFARHQERRRTSAEGADPAALALERSGGRLAGSDLVRLTGTSERQLQRRFRERVGFTPRMARRIVRFSGAIRTLHSCPGISWPALIHACGFYDQAHLIREFQAFSGRTPVEHRVGSIQYTEAVPT